MSTNTTERGLERLICTAQASLPARHAFRGRPDAVQVPGPPAGRNQ